MAEVQSDNPIVRRLLEGTAPAPIKLAAARGALPIEPADLLRVLFALREEVDAEIQAALPATIDGMADEALAGLLTSPSLSPQELHFYAARSAAKPLATGALLGNRSTADTTLELLAMRADESGIELLVTNQVALIRAPSLIDALLENPATSADQRRRLLEVREEFFVKKEREEKRRQDEEARLAKLRQKTDWTAAELERLADDLAKEAQADLASGTLPPDSTDRAASETDEEYRSASQRIMTMSVPEKIMMSIRGSRTDRALLVRDANRLVATGVARSPKLTEQELEYFAGLRNVNDEVLRIIAGRRDAMRHYNTLLILVKNPRCPLPIAINLMSRLQQKDLKHLSGDRNVPETLRRMAKQKLQKSEQ